MTELWKEEKNESRNIARSLPWRENCYYTGVRAGMAYPMWHVEGIWERQVSDTDLQKYPCYQGSPNHTIVGLVKRCPYSHTEWSQVKRSLTLIFQTGENRSYERHRELAGYFPATLAPLYILKNPLLIPHPKRSHEETEDA